MTLHDVEIGVQVERDVAKYGTRRCMAVVTDRDEQGTRVHYVGEPKPVLLPKDDRGPEGWTVVKGTSETVGETGRRREGAK